MSKPNDPVAVSILGKEYRIACEPGTEGVGAIEQGVKSRGARVLFLPVSSRLTQGGFSGVCDGLTGCARIIDRCCCAACK